MYLCIYIWYIWIVWQVCIMYIQIIKAIQIRQIILQKPDRMQENEQNNREQPQRNKQIIFIIAVYLIFTMFSHLTTDTVAFNKNIISIINNADNKDLQVQSIMSIFSAQNYIGEWSSLSSQTLTILSNGDGKSKLKFQKFQTNSHIEYQFQIRYNNGLYIDDGDVVIRVMVPADQLAVVRNSKDVQVYFNFTQTNDSQSQLKAYFLHSKIFKSIDQRVINLSALNLTLTPQIQAPFISVSLTLASPNLLTTSNKIQKQQSTMLSTILFAGILFLISYMQFSSVIEMLRAMFEGRESAQSYSILTILIATMWDAVVCVVAFIQAFGNQESLILFIIPAFLLCLLFTNLELRVLLMIFQARSDNRNIREVICKFNLITYGGLILMYPILKITNLSPIFFIIMSLLVFPQIYHNAQRGQRPNISNSYYSKFLTFRFLLILYLKCFPWNVFDLQPNYLLSFSTIAILAFQIFLLWVQKTSGPKKVVPKFLLPPVFNYQCFLETNLQEGSDVQCAICLASLNTQPEPGANNDPSVPYKIMRGPCGHKFHGTCLAQWMRIKMECPQCRGKLPPFQ